MKEELRTTLINNIAKNYITAFTSAEFEDRLSCIESGRARATNYLKTEMQKNNINKDEMQEAFSVVEKEFDRINKPYIYNPNI